MRKSTVIIILAAVVILTLSKNNPVESARKARFMEDVRSFQDELALSVSKDYVTKKENRNDKFNATEFDDIKEYIPSFAKDYKDKFTIQEDELVYNKDKITENEKKWLDELGIGTKKESFAKKVVEDPKKYYGQYVLNYTTDHEETKDAVEKWQIFHSDGENIYLISDYYIKGQYAPRGKKGNYIKVYTELKDYGEYMVDFCRVINDYSGSEDIINESKAKKWIGWVDSYPNIMNKNIKAVAYMLDTNENVWGTFAGGMAEYAIGGPTLEMYIASYNSMNKTSIACDKNDEVGYYIKDENNDYNYYLGLGTSQKNNLYLKSETVNLRGMWIASPNFCRNSDLYSEDSNRLCSWPYAEASGCGFRPVVCLKSDVTLKEVSGGFEIE